MKIHALPAFSDNIIWAIESAGSLVVVDPGQSDPVIRFLQEHRLRLAAVLITHHHADHTGGIRDLTSYAQSTEPVPVYGPESCLDRGVTERVADNDEVVLFHGRLRLTTIACPGHTEDHVAFFGASPGQDPLLFCGDTLFAGGCGRLLGGTATQLYESLRKFTELPSKTRVFCAHEYTLNNLLFAADLLPENAAIQARLTLVRRQRAQNELTLPSSLKVECNTNPFLLAVLSGSLAQFTAWRAAKDTFRPQP
jgi:hydroxyacylglutathione hydrolase